jgi:hypothetical protein
MKNYSKEAGVAKAGILCFCKRICAGLGRPQEKLVTSMLYGIAASNSCHTILKYNTIQHIRE